VVRAQPEAATLPVADRWVGVGRAPAADLPRAAMDATTAALDGAAEPRLLIAFVPGTAGVAACGEAIAAAAPGVPIIGCAAPVALRGRHARDAELVVAALGGEGLSVSTAAAGGSLREAGAEAAACLGDVADRRHQALLLFVETTAGDPQDVVRGAYSVAGAGIPLVGGGAFAEPPGPPVLLHGTDALASGVVAAAIGSDAPLGVGVRHGLRPIGDPLLVTRAEGSRVLELDGRPALDAYLDRLPPVAEHPDAVLEAMRAHPLGVSRRAGEEQVRTAVDVDLDDRSVTLLGELPQGGLAWIMSSDAASLDAAADAACAAALAPLDGAAPRGLISFQSILRDGCCREAIVRCAPGAPVATGRTAGQIARTRGLVGFHNQALSVLALG